MKPQRIQRKRTKGWKMPANTVYVGRPSQWGNPYRVRKDETRLLGVNAAKLAAVQRFRQAREHQAGFLMNARFDLRGKNLACWCPLDQPCHADVLLELANAD